MQSVLQIYGIKGCTREIKDGKPPMVVEIEFEDTKGANLFVKHLLGDMMTIPEKHHCANCGQEHDIRLREREVD